PKNVLYRQSDSFYELFVKNPITKYFLQLASASKNMRYISKCKKSHFHFVRKVSTRSEALLAHSCFLSREHAITFCNSDNCDEVLPTAPLIPALLGMW